MTTWHPPLALPLVVTSPFGARGSGQHYGTDYATRDASGRPETGHRVYAMAAGVVTGVSEDARAGLSLSITTDEGFRIGYAHLSGVLVEPGQRVSGGEWIALSGNTGTVTGPHLHVQVRDPSGAWLDPDSLLRARSPVPGGLGAVAVLLLGAMVWTVLE